MGALFVGSLTTYSHTYSGSSKNACSVLRKALHYIHRSKTQRQGERIGGHHGRFLKNHFPADQLVPACHQLAALQWVVGADTGRETVMTGCHRRTARHWNAIASGEDWKSRENGTDTDQQSRSQSGSGNPSGDMSASHSHEWQNQSALIVSALCFL